MKYNTASINKLHTIGIGILKEAKASISKSGTGHVPRWTDPETKLLSVIESMSSLTTDHIAGMQKARYTARFNRERESALESLWKVYVAIQHYNENGAFLEGSQSKMISFTPDLENHLVRSHDESPKNGVFYRPSEAQVQPVTEGPLARVAGMECEPYGARWESRKTFKMCSKVDTVNGGRSVMAIGAGMSFPAGTTFETYTVKLFPVVSETFIDALGTPITVTDPNWVRSVSRIGEGREHTVRVPIYNY